MRLMIELYTYFLHDCESVSSTYLIELSNSVKNMFGYIDGLVQDCSDSIAKALELLVPCTKPSI